VNALTPRKQVPLVAFPQLFCESALFFSVSWSALTSAEYEQLVLPSHQAIAEALWFSASTLAVAATEHPPPPLPVWDSEQSPLALAFSLPSSPVACRLPWAEKL
jgi:hypothetical protein